MSAPRAALLTGPLLLLVGGVTDALQAQEPTAGDTLEPAALDEVVVTVTRRRTTLDRAPFAVSILDAEEALASERRESLADLLGSVPGVQVFDRRNEALGDRIVVRGAGARSQFGVRGVRVVVDGVPLTLPDGQTTLTNLDLGAAQDVEVLRGPAAALYGNAAGGVIRLRSGGFTGGPLRLRPRLTAGADGFRKEEAGAAARSGGVDWTVHAAHATSDGFREHASAETWRANLIARTDVGASRLRGVVNVYHTPFARNPSSLAFEDARERPRSVRPAVVEQGLGEEARQLQAGLSGRVPLGEGVRLEASAWGLGRELWNPIPSRVIDLDRAAGGARATVEGTAGGPLSWTAGLEAGLQRDDRRERENLGIGPEGGRAREGELLLDQLEEVAYLAPFLRVSADLLPRLTVTGAARLDAYRFEASDALLADGDDSGARRLSRLSPTVGVSWRPARSAALYLNLSTAFETPTLSELSNRPDGGGGLDPDLGAERLVSWEAGARVRVPGARLEAEGALYEASVTAALVPYEGPGGTVYYRNAGEVSRTGVELRIGWRPRDWLALTGTGAWQDHRFERFRTPEGRFDGRRVPGVPVHRARLAIEAGDDRGPGVRAALGWTDDYPVDDANDAHEPSYRVVELRGSWTVDRDGWRLRAFLAMDNVFGERYDGSIVPNAFGGRYYEPAPGRQLFGGIEVGLPGP